MDKLVDTSVFRYARYLLIAATLLISPIAAAAVLASYDLGGAARTSPTTMGALESVSNVGGDVPEALPTPVGLSVQRI